MRARSLIVAAALAGLAGPASAQFLAPVGSDPYGLVAPGILGSADANTAFGQERCPPVTGGRNGPPRYDCPPAATPSPRAH